MGQLIGFRALQGLGGGGLMIGVETIVGDLVAPRDRGRYQGLFGACSARRRTRALGSAASSTTPRGAGSSTSTFPSASSPWGSRARPHNDGAPVRTDRLPGAVLVDRGHHLPGPHDHPRRHHLGLGIGEDRRLSPWPASPSSPFVVVERRAEEPCCRWAVQEPGLRPRHHDGLRRRLRDVRHDDLPAAVPSDRDGVTRRCPGSGCCPCVGLLLTSVGSGQLVSRTGR